MTNLTELQKRKTKLILETLNKHLGKYWTQEEVVERCDSEHLPGEWLLYLDGKVILKINSETGEQIHDG